MIAITGKENKSYIFSNLFPGDFNDLSSKVINLSFRGMKLSDEGILIIRGHSDNHTAIFVITRLDTG